MRSLSAVPALGRQTEGAVFAFLDQIAHLHQLAGQVHPLLLVQLSANAVGGELVMAQAQDLFAFRAEQDVGHVAAPKRSPVRLTQERNFCAGRVMSVWAAASAVQLSQFRQFWTA